MAKFGNGEKVLCFHGPLLYEAKCLKSINTGDNNISYLLQYDRSEDWKNSWSEWVPESRLIKYNKNNLVIQKELLRIHKENPATNKTKKKITNGDADSNDHDHNGIGDECEDEGEEKFECTKCEKMFDEESDLDRHWQWHILQLEHMQSCDVILKKVKLYRCDSCTRCSLYAEEMEEHQKYCRRKNVISPNNSILAKDSNLSTTTECAMEIACDVPTNTSLDETSSQAVMNVEDNKNDEESDDKVEIEIDIIKNNANSEESNTSQNNEDTNMFIEIDLLQKWEPEQMKHMLSSYIELKHVKYFKCRFCNNIYPDTEKLRVHEKKYFKTNITRPQDIIDDGIHRPYKCTTCDWKFVKKSTLDAHSVVHKPFPHICECGVGYYQLQDLKDHRKLVHPDYKPLPPLKPTQPVSQKPKKAKTIIKQSKPKPTTLSKPLVKQKLQINPTTISKQQYVKVKHRAVKTGNTPKPTRTPRVKSEMRMELEADENGDYICTLCGEACSTGDELADHLYKDHTTRIGNSYKCNYCDKVAVSRSNLKVHLIGHAGLKPFVCPICNGRYSQSGALKMHLKRHENLRQFPCDQCGKAFYDIQCLTVHKRTHTGEKPYECEHCFRRFADPSAFKRHLVIHTGLKPHKCKLCPKAFCDPAALFRHKRVHAGYTVPCTECDRTFATNSSLRYHFKITHQIVREENQFECDYCGRKYSIKHNLKTHILAFHMKARPRVECDICLKTLAHNQSLERHLEQVHLKLTKFECDICGRRFLFLSQLKNHIIKVHRSKNAEKKYECDYCQKRLCNKSDVTRHIWGVHLGIRCKICKNAFATTARLKKHKVEGCKTCAQCGKAFRNWKAVEDHYLVSHVDKNKQPKFMCDYCGKDYPLKKMLSKHIKGHVRPAEVYHCAHCSKTSLQKQLLRRHIWDAHMLSLYCDVCLKKFYSESEFRRHKRKANCRRLELACSKCDRIFTVKSIYRGHLLKHIHLERFFECDFCGVHLKRKTELINHIRRAHETIKTSQDGGIKVVKKSQVEMVEAVKMSQVKILEPVETSQVGMIEAIETSPVEKVELVETSQVGIIEAIETSPVEMVEPLETSLVGMIEWIETSPSEMVEPVETSQVGMIEAIETSPLEMIEHVETSQVEMIDAVETSQVEAVKQSQVEMIDNITTIPVEQIPKCDDNNISVCMKENNV